jgi:hypothetical protein
MGVATMDLSMTDFSLYKSYPVAYRAVVVHNSDGARAGCGLIGAPSKLVATIDAYPECEFEKCAGRGNCLFFSSSSNSTGALTCPSFPLFNRTLPHSLRHRHLGRGHHRHGHRGGNLFGHFHDRHRRRPGSERVLRWGPHPQRRQLRKHQYVVVAVATSPEQYLNHLPTVEL